MTDFQVFRNHFFYFLVFPLPFSPLLFFFFFLVNFALDSAASQPLSSQSVTIKHTSNLCFCVFAGLKMMLTCRCSKSISQVEEMSPGLGTGSHSSTSPHCALVPTLPPHTRSYFLFHCLHLSSSLSFFSYSLYSHPLSLAAPSSFNTFSISILFSPLNYTIITQYLHASPQPFSILLFSACCSSSPAELTPISFHPSHHSLLALSPCSLLPSHLLSSHFALLPGQPYPFPPFCFTPLLLIPYSIFLPTSCPFVSLDLCLPIFHVPFCTSSLIFSLCPIYLPASSSARPPMFIY